MLSGRCPQRARASGDFGKAPHLCTLTLGCSNYKVKLYRARLLPNLHERILPRIRPAERGFFYIQLVGPGTGLRPVGKWPNNYRVTLVEDPQEAIRVWTDEDAVTVDEGSA